MNPNEFHQMYKYLVRPSREKVVAAAKKELGIPQEAKINNGTEILDWINYNQKAYGDNTQPMTPEERKTGESIEKTIAGGHTANADQLKGLKGRLENARQYTTPPKNKKEKKGWKYTSWADQQVEEEKPTKKIIKKEIKVVEKPRPTIQEQLSFEDYLNIIDPNWLDEEEPKVKRITVKDKKLAEGIRGILNLHKRQT